MTINYMHYNPIVVLPIAVHFAIWTPNAIASIHRSHISYGFWYTHRSFWCSKWNAISSTGLQQLVTQEYNFVVMLIAIVHFHIFCADFFGLLAQGKQNVPGLCAWVSIELCTILLTKAACTTLSFTWQRANVDFREVQVPVYINRCKSSLNWAWLEICVSLVN